MNLLTDVSQEAIEGLADVIFEAHDTGEVPVVVVPDAEIDLADHVDGLATACLAQWAGR